MAIDNLNYYSSWLPAGQLTDKYSSLPWCLKSKNLDIFSSSKSVKATAWSAPTQTDADVIKQSGNLVLKTDWKVYTRSWWTDTLLVDPSTNFPVYPVSYTWENWPFADATWGTSQDLVAKYEWDVLKSFTVFSDRSSYTWSDVKYVPNKSFWWDTDKLIRDPDDIFYDWYEFTKTGGDSYLSLEIIIENAPFASVPIRIKATEVNSIDSHISLENIRLLDPQWYYYDAELDWMTPTAMLNSVTHTVPFSWDILDWIDVTIPAFPTYKNRRVVRLNFKWTKTAWSSTTLWNNWYLYIDMNWWPESDHRMNWVYSAWDYNEYWTYLPVRNRKLVPVWEYYWMKSPTFQVLYQWNYQWVEVNWAKLTRYDFEQYMWWVSDVSMDVIGMIVWNEQVYMIWNMGWNWYIIPCDLTWWVGTPYIAYGCIFKWVTNIDYLLYLVGENRWISNLWVYNWQELVSVIWGNKEKTYNDIIDLDEQYKFDWKIVNWRKNLILSTSDNRLFQYWQTYGGKGWSFIHQLPSNAVIKDLKANWNDLEVEYSITASWTTTNYKIKYQDDTPIKNYNTEWEATYPIVIWNHLLEKEESDLYCSYILPSSSCSLELWACANHYHFWTFKIPHTDTPPTPWSTWDIQWLANGLVLVTTRLEFIEKNGDYYTFRLVWELPVMSGNETWKLIYLAKNQSKEMTYTEVNHFRKIWEVTADKFTEWEFRFHNLNNKLELPKSHSLQIMVRGKGTANFTPELFALDLVANQRDRW